MASTTDELRDRATITEHHIENTSYTKYPGNYYGRDDSWKLDEFEEKCRVHIQEYHKGRDLTIDICGIGPAIANAYRRIMMAEVPTMAIEHCFIYNNTSVIQDEMLAHRIGLIPIRADPTRFDYKPKDYGPEQIGKNHTLIFRLTAKCEKLPDVNPEKTGRREDIYKDYKVYSGHIKWEPMPGQKDVYRGKDAIRPVHKNIIIAKLSGNQEIDTKLHAYKGIGRDHAKFSPVATVSYRLMPIIKLKEKITGEPAQRLKDSFSEGVIELKGHKGEAKVVNPRLDSGSRNIFRYADLKDKVTYELDKDYFIFKIESVGAIPAIDILLQSCDIFESKCEAFLKELKACRSGVDESAPVVESV